MKPVPRSSFGLLALTIAAAAVTLARPTAASGQVLDSLGRGAIVRTAALTLPTAEPPAKTAVLIAHRGASAYAPEHTLEAYELAIDQGVDFIEPGVQVSRDGHLVVIHDLTLNRTTDVAEVYPWRFREDRDEDGGVVRRWYVRDFTLAELRRLDAGSWFGPRFAGARIPTLDEVLELAVGRVGVFPETKSPEVYQKLGHDMERLLVDALERHGLAEPGAVPRTPVFVQSFSAASLRRLRQEVGSALPSALLLAGRDASYWLSDDGLTEIETFATGVGPTKGLLTHRPDVVGRVHDHGLLVIPWAFGPTDTGDFESVVAEMRHYLCDLRVDGLVTDDPDAFASAAACLATR